MITMMYPSSYTLKSSIELLILLTIEKEKEIHGFELIKKLDKFQGWKPQAGTVYPILERLKNRGLLEKIEASEGSTRKKALYKLTEKGLEVLKGSMGILEMSMDFFEKIFENAFDIFDDDVKFIDFIQNRFQVYLKIIQNKKFKSNPESILRLSQFYGVINEELIKINKKISELKEEEKFVKIDIQ